MKIIHIVPSLVKGSGVTEMLYQINKNCNSKKFKNYFLLWDNTEKLNFKKNIILKKNINSLFIFFFLLKIYPYTVLQKRTSTLHTTRPLAPNLFIYFYNITIFQF